MRLAVISDIHGNCVALDAVLAELRAEAIDQIVCLGDAIQGGAQPKEVVQRLRELACPVVMGNADAFLLSGHADETKEPVTAKHRAVREWQLGQLSADDRAFIASFQPTITIPLDGDKQLLCFHGSPRSFDDVFLPDTPEADFQRLLGDYRSFVLTGGHTHLQYVRRLGDSFYFNPGSVGLAYNHALPEENFRADPWAEYAILFARSGRLRLEFRRVPFDVDLLIHTIRSSGKPYADSSVQDYQGRGPA